ncbi:hypothetical protein BASA61_004068 [Batrachochytrium salamandrivorans]|nr:hypothetical protein BASA62_007956 [Batrachochytrium salamandrivorans]KAH6581954.1 hypothetical protein BASA60_002205 [Batrachochytrium salamandrivorans]KAH6594191.1 hypothetical protein BASA61_004068 [Batrachochytrium salamandrivorans]
MQNSTLSKDLQVTPLQNAISGAAAGVISRVVIAPLDVIKIRNVVQACKLIVKEEGLRGLWKGNLSAEYLYLAYGAIQFTIFHELLLESKKPDSLLATYIPHRAHTFVAGALSGFVATISTYPLDLLRTRFAVQQDYNIYKSLFGAVQQIFAKEGISGFYRGMFPSLVQIVPQMGLVFETHGFFKGLFKDIEKHSPAIYSWTKGSHDIVCGALAGIVSKTVMMPFDVIRKRYQVQGPVRNSIVVSNVPRYHKGLFGTAMQIIRHEGVLALYKGIVPCLAKAAPSSAVTFFIVNECRQAFDHCNRDQQ